MTEDRNVLRERISMLERYREFVQSELASSRQDTVPYPDVKVGDYLFRYDGWDDNSYTQYLVIEKCYETNHCIVIDALDVGFKPPRYAYSGLHRSLREAMEAALQWDLKYYEGRKRITEKALEIHARHQDASEAIDEIEKMVAEEDASSE